MFLFATVTGQPILPRRKERGQEAEWRRGKKEEPPGRGVPRGRFDTQERVLWSLLFIEMN